MRCVTPALVLGPALAVLAASGCAAPAGRVELGVRGGTTLCDGEPTNDMPDYGVVARFGLTERQRIGCAVDFSGFDVERPAKILGLDPAREVDADGSMVKLSGWYELAYRAPHSRIEWFAGAGGALGFVDVGDADGDLSGGGTWDIETDGGTELIPFLLGGIRYAVGEKWVLEVGGRLEQHFSEWELEDKVSGREETIDEYFAAGLYMGLNYAF